MKSALLSFFTFALALLGSACAINDNSPPTSPLAPSYVIAPNAPEVPSTPANPSVFPSPQTGPSLWPTQEQHSKDGTASVSHSDMPPEERDRIRNEYRQTSLVEVPVDSSFNVSLFKIKDVPEWQNTIFIAPRIYAYGGAQGGRVAPERHSDGAVSLAFSVVLTDGTHPQIPSPDGKRDIDLPSTFLIHDLDRLRETLGAVPTVPTAASPSAVAGAAPGSGPTLSPLPGCPTHLSLRINDEELDVTPSDLARGDYCQLEKPFNVTARMPEQQARYLLEEALYANAVEIRATYETRVAFIDSRASVSFNKAKLFHEIEAELGARAGVWADLDAQVHVANIVKSEALNIDIQGDAGPLVDNIVNQAMQVFFERFTPDPTTTGFKECGAAVACLRLNYNYSHEQDSFTFSWTHSTSVLTGQNYVTWTQLTPMTDKEAVIGDGVRADGELRAPLSSRNPLGFETGLTVLPGDLLEITPSYLIREEREQCIPRLKRASHPTCMQSTPPFDRRVCHTTHGGHGGDPDTECATEHVPAQCTKTEDHWIDTLIYGSSEPRFPRIDEPIGQLQQIFDGLVLRFTWRDPATGLQSDVSCPLNSFSREGDGKSLLVRIENRGDGCRIFTDTPNVQPMLYLVNRIDFPVTYLEGRRVTTWDDRVLETPVEKTYHPETWFAGQIAIRGYDFGGTATHGEQAPPTLR